MNEEKLTYEELSMTTRLSNLTVILPPVVMLLVVLLVIDLTNINNLDISNTTIQNVRLEEAVNGSIFKIDEVIQEEGEDIYRIGFENNKSNLYNQRYELEQDGNIVYATSIIRPGGSLNHVYLYAINKDKDYATVKIFSVDEDGYDFGSPVIYDVKIDYLD